MSYRKFFEGGSEDQSLNELARFLTNPNIRVLWNHAETLMFKQKDKGIYGKTIFYVFYQDIKEELHQELDTFKGKLEIAKEISIDERYQTLKNQKQRELFLLSEYFLSKTEAQDVIELLKPELAHIIKEREERIEEDESIPIEEQHNLKLRKSIDEISDEELDKEMKEFEEELSES